MSPTFFLRRGDRLAARLRHILYAWRFTRQLDAQLLVSWLPRNKSLYGTLDSEYYGLSLVLDLERFYSQKISSEIVFFEGQFSPSTNLVPFPPAHLAAQMPNDVGRDAFVNDSSFYISDSYFLRFSDENKDDVRQQVKEMFGRLPFNADVERSFQAAKGQLGSEYVALHVRRGDIVNVLRAAIAEFKTGMVTKTAQNYANHLAKQSAPIEYYFPEVEAAIRQGRRVAFFSDTPDTISVFRKKFGANRIIDSQRIGSRLAYPLQKALLDFLLLGSAGTLIGTQTGFASFAADMGGADYVIVTARGSWGDFQDFLYKDVLCGETIPESARKTLEAACIDEYEKYHQRAVRLGLTLPRQS